MKCKIYYEIILDTIEDSILKEMQDYMIKLKILPDYYDLVKIKYDYDFYDEETKEYIRYSSNPSTEFFDYNSMEHKKILKFNGEKGLVLNYNIIKGAYEIIEYSKSDYINCEYFKLILNFYQSNISEKCINENNKKINPINLTENFIIFDNKESLVCNKNIVNKVQFQEYNTGYANLYFINKSLGEFFEDNNFTGFKLLPVKKINTDEIIFYQLKVTNIIEQPKIKTEISSLFSNEGVFYPTEKSPLCNYFKKDNDVCIYNDEYILNNFKDFNLSYMAFNDSDKFFVRPEITVSRRVMLLLKQHKSKFAMIPIYSDKNIDINKFIIDKEVKELINYNMNKEI